MLKVRFLVLSSCSAIMYPFVPLRVGYTNMVISSIPQFISSILVYPWLSFSVLLRFFHVLRLFLLFYPPIFSLVFLFLFYRCYQLRLPFSITYCYLFWLYVRTISAVVFVFSW